MHIIFFSKSFDLLAQAVGNLVGQRSGSSVATINDIIFFLFFFSFLFSFVYFSHRRSALIKKPVKRKLTGAPKTYR